jgi:hydrogenase maturation protease
MILGLGNDLMGDDGVGLAILERLAQSDFPALFPTVRLEWGGTAGMGLLRHFRESDVVIVVDGIETGSEPGSIFRFSAEDILGKNLRSESLHGVGIPQLVAHARLTGARPQVIVCSVQVGEVLPRFNSLTPAVAAAVEPVCGLVREEVRRILTPDRLPSTARRGAAALSA